MDDTKAQQKASRKQFTFYRSFYESAQQLPQESCFRVICAIVEYGLYGTASLPLTGAEKAVLLLAMPVLDTARKRAAHMKRYNEESNPRRKRKPNDNVTKHANTAEVPQSLAVQAVAGFSNDKMIHKGKKKKKTEKKTEIKTEIKTETEQNTARSEAAVTAVTAAVGPLTRAERAELCAYEKMHGLAAIEQACRVTQLRGGRSWAYVRKVLDGGAKLPAQAGFQQHGTPLSPRMIEAARKMLAAEEEKGE